MKTCKTLTLCLVAIFCLVLFAAPKAEAATDGYYTYSVSGGKATITDVDTAISGAVTVPASVTTIGTYAFSGCTQLSRVNYEGTETQWSAVTIRQGNEPLTSATISCNSQLPHTHSYTNYISNNDATCTADGTKTATCDRCTQTNTVTKNPSDQTVVLGYKGQFTATAAGESLRYQWEYKRPGGEKWIETAMEGATKATVYMESTTFRDGYQYRCKLIGLDGCEAYTDPATLTVK